MDEERKFNLSVDIKEKKKSGTVLMTEGSIWKKLLIFSVPLILRGQGGSGGGRLNRLYRQSADSVQPGCIGRRRRYYIAVHGCKA